MSPSSEKARSRDGPPFLHTVRRSIFAISHLQFPFFPPFPSTKPQPHSGVPSSLHVLIAALLLRRPPPFLLDLIFFLLRLPELDLGRGPFVRQVFSMPDPLGNGLMTVITHFSLQGSRDGDGVNEISLNPLLPKITMVGISMFDCGQMSRASLKKTMEDMIEELEQVSSFLGRESARIAS